MNKQLIISALGAMLLASCADEFDRSYEVGRPDNVAEYGYLSDYKPLKEYVDRSKYPNFKLGVGTTVNDYLKKELVYGLTNSNFDETVAGNAMKMASCVNDNGDMDFSTVSEYVNTATDAGLSVYGHTLAWHAQQPVKWLTGLIKDRPIEVDPNEKIETLVTTMTYTDGPFPFYPMGCEPPVINGALHFEPTGEWSQFFICPGGNNVLTEGDHRVYLEITSSAAADGVQLTLQNGWGGDAQNITLPVPIVEGHEIYELNFPGIVGGSYDCILKPQTAMATLDVHSIKVTKLEAPAMEIFVDQVDNSAMEEGKPMNNFIVREKGKGDVPGPILVGQGPDGMNCTAITSVANPENSWDTQFFIVANKAWEGGAKYKISFWYRATAEAGSETQCHGDPGGYMHWAMLPQNPNFTTEWQYYEATSTIPAEGNGMKTIAFNLNVNPNVVTYYFADIKWQSVETGNTIPLTPEEKKDTLTWAMDKWIGGMMAACDGNVKAWDVVNEAISGGDADGEGVYALQHGAEGNTTDFFWQDYLGDIDYVRTAVRFARQYGPQDVKLFVNDYNLESDWDNNGKLKSLIKWIERWEADGVTKIDGIGTQMHISCYMNPQTQESKKKAIVESFKLMAATGKLVRISELDMGLVDANGNDVITSEVTEEQHKAMAELYKYIIQQYLTIIPVNQQWGICQWAPTDSPAGSGWRANSPIGLWDLNYNRKHTYAGFADGLKGE
ncbi:MAG: endo-1,4-beta-xylanase [Prevotella sp.]|nr:endo-1,4-beta-xylanase [Prevotella sp.]